MLFQVRILDAKGEIKKLVSSGELKRRHWQTFDKSAPFSVKSNAKDKPLRKRNQKLSKKILQKKLVPLSI